MCKYKNSFVPDADFLRTRNFCKRVLKVTKLAYSYKTQGSMTSQWLQHHDFWRVANRVLSKGKSATLSLFNGLKVFSFDYDKRQLLVNILPKNYNLDYKDLYFSVFYFKTNLKLNNSPLSPKLFKKVIRNLSF